MDLGIAGRRALVCASSKGLGRGCAEALAAEGVEVVLNARAPEALAETAASIRATYGVSVQEIAADITTEEGRASVLAAAGTVDILVTNAGGPPPGNWRDWQRADFIAALDANALTPIALMTALVPGMCERGWGRVINITSVSVKSPIAILGLSNTARTALTGYVAGVARDVASQGVILTIYCRDFMPLIERLASMEWRQISTTRRLMLFASEECSLFPHPDTGRPRSLARPVLFCVQSTRAL